VRTAAENWKSQFSFLMMKIHLRKFGSRLKITARVSLWKNATLFSKDSLVDQSLDDAADLKALGSDSPSLTNISNFIVDEFGLKIAMTALMVHVSSLNFQPSESRDDKVFCGSSKEHIRPRDFRDANRWLFVRT
jgi:acyl carrier protein